MKIKTSTLTTTLLLLLATICTTQAQWTTTGANVNTTGKAGIGMASAPAAELHIKAIGSSNTWADMLFESTAGKQWSFSGRDDKLVLVNWANTSTSSDYVTILDNGGYVGIGTNAPRAKLDVSGDFTGGILSAVLSRLPEGNSSGDGTYLGVRGWATQNTSFSGKGFSLEHGFYGNINSSMNFFRGAGSSTGGYITFNTGSNTEQITINSTGQLIVKNGNIGIRTTAPGAYLDIADNNASPGTHFLEIGDHAFLSDLDQANVLGIYGQEDPTQCGIKLGSANPLIYGYNGNIGINTATPAATLDVNGTLRVMGAVKITDKVHAAEFRACMDPNSTCPPDYVFEDDYPLMPLAEVQKYIRKNKHLPEVPSASQMLQDGVGMAEMNMTLLKKVEEITLYMLQMQKEIEELKKLVKK